MDRSFSYCMIFLTECPLISSNKSTEFFLALLKSLGNVKKLITLSNVNLETRSQRNHQHDEAGDSEAMRMAVADAMQAHAASKPFEGSSSAKPNSQASQMTSSDEQQAFAQTFKSWRQQNAAR